MAGYTLHIEHLYSKVWREQEILTASEPAAATAAAAATLVKLQHREKVIYTVVGADKVSETVVEERERVVSESLIEPKRCLILDALSRVRFQYDHDSYWDSIVDHIMYLVDNPAFGSDDDDDDGGGGVYGEILIIGDFVSNHIYQCFEEIDESGS